MQIWFWHKCPIKCLKTTGVRDGAIVTCHNFDDFDMLALQEIMHSLGDTLGFFLVCSTVSVAITQIIT